MTEKKTWFITGAGRGMRTDIAKVASLHEQIGAVRDLSTSLANAGGD
jgi:hypothetical protein